VKRGYFGTRLGFYFASLGSAFGLGNLWRFPYVAYENGGGAFVFLFFVILFLFGLPLMVAELSLGKITRSSSIQAFRVLEKSWIAHALGMLSPLLSLLVLSYYSVVSGWVLYFLGTFLSKAVFGSAIDASHTLQYLHHSGVLQIVLAFAHLALVTWIVGHGVELGMERAVGYFMPVFILLVIGLCAHALSIDQSAQLLKMFLYPDFSKLHLASFSRALGQALFTLGLGFGTMITFGSYLSEKVFLPFAAFRVVALDAILSLFAGILIFPLIGMMPLAPNGPELMFQTVPIWLTTLPAGLLFGCVFFLCLYLAALGASIGLLETVASNLQDLRELRPLSRLNVSLLAGGACFVISVLPAASSTWLAGVNTNGRSLLEILDTVLIDIGLPIAALLVCWVVSRRLDGQLLKRELLLNETEPGIRLMAHWLWVVRWLVPAAVVLALCLQMFGAFL
jgi:NSS family neurotransmitter:Na+ symporter